MIDNYSRRIILHKSDLALQTVSMDSIPEQHRTRFLNPGEIEVLTALVLSVQARKMVEFGCQNGRTAAVLLANVPTLQTYIGIDVPPTFVPAERVQRGECPERPGELALYDPRFRLLLAGRGSHDLKASDLGSADVAFIDGDHSIAGVMNDYQLSLDAGCELIIFHDDHLLGNVGVHEALDGIAESHTVFHIDGTWISYISLAG